MGQRWTHPHGGRIRRPATLLAMAAAAALCLATSSSASARSLRAAGGSSLVGAAPALATSATTASWGANEFGQLGNGTTENSRVPLAVSGLGEISDLAAGTSDSLALLSAGTVTDWGNNFEGRLGDGSLTGPEKCGETPCSRIPAAVPGLSGVTDVVSGGEFSLALLSNHTVEAWGSNQFGQLGDGSTESSDVPVAVSNLSEVVAISAGLHHGLAVLSNGTVKTWGDNAYGELGDGSFSGPEMCGETPCSKVPVTVSGLTGVTTVAGGGEFSLALLSNETVTAWGDNQFGELGIGSTENRDSPAAVRGLSGVSAIAAGDGAGYALLKAGTVTSWGNNSYGQLGDGSTAFSDVPVNVSNITGVSAIAASAEDGLALLSSGKVMDWGANQVGQLGNGASEDSEVPVQVKGLSEASAIASGGFSSLAYGVLAIPSVTSVEPSSGPAAGGTTVTITGTNFSGATAVKFGTANATSFTVESETSIKAVSPSGKGIVDVTVTNPSGTSAVSSADHFSYGPSVSRVEPTMGPATGGTSVTITGINLNGATAVKFGTANATSFSVESETSISAVSPAGRGTVDVTVTTPSGTSPTSSADEFSYGPTVMKVEPQSGPAAGGTSVVISGADFGGATAVKFGTANATSFTVESETSISAVSPPGKGTVDVTVTTPNGTSPTSSADHFSYGPTVTKVEPPTGSVVGGTTVAISGTSFGGATAVKFGSSNAKSFTVSSETSISAVSPPGTGRVDVTVVTPSGTSPTGAGDQFTYNAPWEHPQVFVSAEKRKGSAKVPVIGWGTITLSNRRLASLTCGNLVYGDLVNETEPSGSTERGYGEVLTWAADGYANNSGGELAGKCKSTTNLEAWVTVEPELEKQYERVTLAEGTEAGSERLAIKQFRRRALSIPWREEAYGEQNTESERHYYVRTGIATAQRAEVEAEEAAAKVPPERRSGCYRFPAFTEIVRKPGLTSAKETELALRPAPAGCIEVTIVLPEAGLELPFQGTLEPEFIDGARNGLTPSKAEFKGGFIGSELGSERSSERNERYLISPYGRGYMKTGIALKEMGLFKEELLQLRAGE